MENYSLCPICENKLRIIKKSTKLIEKTCTKGMNHSLQFLVSNNIVQQLKVSLDAKYSKFIEINFAKNNGRIILLLKNKQTDIQIDKLLEPDFPSLKELKERVELYISIS